MKTRKGIDIYGWMWAAHDNVCVPNPPAWSCFCLSFNIGENSSYYTCVEGCHNCGGFGFMPIPPSEVGL